ncbi:uncharacterized protein BDV14DRAFT_90363 [Aspergillus stella-maris]|uniref:uncharacterized protein n=1 Tax=Aspergillus stella-maris TaxID=1810926 RepID=UPI003CCD8E21
MWHSATPLLRSDHRCAYSISKPPLQIWQLVPPKRLASCLAWLFSAHWQQSGLLLNAICVMMQLILQKIHYSLMQRFLY